MEMKKKWKNYSLLVQHYNLIINVVKKAINMIMIQKINNNYNLNNNYNNSNYKNHR
jgi:hypothetical protein